MRGFGTAITDASASVLYTLSPAQRSSTMARLFDPSAGDGLNLGGRPVPYAKVTLDSSSGTWWSVADVRAYTGG